MYKDLIVPKETNETMAKRINQKLEQVAEKLSDTEQNDTDFMSNLYNLCVLNHMADSHDG